MESALSAENQVIGLSLAMVGTFPLVAVSVPNQIQLQNKKKVSLACSLSVKAVPLPDGVAALDLGAVLRPALKKAAIFESSGEGLNERGKVKRFIHRCPAPRALPWKKDIAPQGKTTMSVPRVLPPSLFSPGLQCFERKGGERGLDAEKGIATSDASKEALAYTYTTATLIDIDECGLRTLIPEPSSSLVFMPTCRDAKEEGRLTTQTLTNQWP
ncbi:hypothetical protein V6N12_075972 [Hibiscus sabdariffa]|uniref:Uncharacterized protein n=1 Tax=Hibiscus sabdariffa TaxID=183260 RepID=A0ABR2AXX2_9ROSI